MSRRSRDWNEGLSEDLKDPDFAQEFVKAALDEGVALNVILGKIVRAYGLKEYAQQAGIAAPNILRATQPDSNPTHRTVSRLLAPLGLRLSVAPAIALTKAKRRPGTKTGEQTREPVKHKVT